MTMADIERPTQSRSSSAASMTEAAPLVEQDRLDVPGVIDEHLLLGCVKHARNAALLKHLRVTFVLDAENPRKRRNDPRRNAETTAAESARVDLDDDYAYEAFKESVVKANELIRLARVAGDDNDRTVFVFCTHGNNEGVVVCIAFLMLTEKWTLERAYKHVQVRRPASAPRRVYIDQLRRLEREVHGRVTLRSAQVGPSMMDLMLGLRGESRSDDADETASQITEPETQESHVERASFATNFSVTTGLHNGSSLRETMIIAERDEEYDAVSSGPPEETSPPPSTGSSRGRPKLHRKDCVIS
ncbi:hypothetical protein PINS_up011269 [Pythium insidiosum]|nr:hypothetical protein PINS_up011269 [Pythium insidiosum]